MPIGALHLMLRRYRWSVPAAYRLLPHVPIARPKDGLPLHLQPLDHRFSHSGGR